MWLALWLIVALIALGIEIAAAYANQGGTLSELWWYFLGKGQEFSPWVHLRRIIAIVIWGWLTIHLFFFGWI